ncbi:spore coat protein [Aneurinibacillus sp. Ricciae_BoGa-3]|uniref:spore coat protein n=1 Tax=Aneurinibacillus sp. Ricciae_BoGa-3 TaxID=3022697 RepID=UPI002340D250|nr:spore coat protein [Aneurinibacillus sp. Ricciae_BoGa-3]WCK53966.1 spore coat protein [Aneurinibacillus sp. Ricciae_BoGa-3]
MPQQNNMIGNPKPTNEPKVKGPQMNDRDRMNDILATEKYLTDGFNIAAREASHAQLHRDIMTILNETHQCTRDAFEMMFQKGWYKIEAEDQSKLTQTFNQFSNYSSQFPYTSPLQ